MSETTPVAPAPPVQPSGLPEDDLANKKKELTQAQADVTTASKKVTSLQDEVKGLEAKVNEIKQAQAGYKQTSESQKQQFDDDKKTLGQKNSIAEAVLKELTKKIDGIVDDFDKALGVQADEVQKAWNNAQQAAKDAEGADGAAKQAQADFDKLKKLPTSNDLKLKDVASLLGDVSKTEAQNDFVAMYFWVNVAQKITDLIKIPTADEYDKQVRSAQDTADQTKAGAAEKRSNADKLASDYADKKQKLDKAQASRRADILTALKKVQAVAAPVAT